MNASSPYVYGCSDCGYTASPLGCGVCKKPVHQKFAKGLKKNLLEGPVPGKVILSNHTCDFTGLTNECKVCRKTLTEHLAGIERHAPVKKVKTAYKPTPDQVVAKKTKLSNVRAAVYERDGHACVFCGKEDQLTLDHIKPRSLKGKTTYDNLQTACFNCNQKKGNKYPYPNPRTYDTISPIPDRA